LNEEKDFATEAMKETEALIIGAGPAGITAALYLKRAGVSLVWLEKGAPGGKILTISEIGNYPGLPEASGLELAQSLLKSTAAEGLEPEYGDVKSLTKERGRFKILTDDETYLAQAVVVATGLANVPTLKGEKAFFGRGVSYCATCDGPMYKNKAAALYGTGDPSLEEALYLSPLVKKLYVLTPEAEYQGSPLLLSALEKEPSVEMICSAKIEEILGSSHVEKIAYSVKGVAKEIPVDVVFPLYGEKSASAFLSPLKVKEDQGFLLVDETMMCSVSGLFAAGDIVKKKLRQVVTAASDGAIASAGVVSYLRSLKGDHHA
jgi:thioredoxin reductase (NADPH)